MKKIYLTAAAALCGLASQAIELSFWIGNQKITPGETVEFNEVSVKDYATYKEVTMKPDLRVSSDIYTSSLKVTATCVSGQSIQMCAGGLCKGGETITKENVTVQTGQKLSLGFDYVGELDPGEEIPRVTTMFEAEDTTEPGSKTGFVLVMGPQGASLVRVEAVSGLSAVAGGLAYEVEGSARLAVYNAAGVSVGSAVVSGSGVVSLPSGTYIAVLGGKASKITVR